jgi:transposase-like protein
MPARHTTQCTVCRHRECAAINLALARGVAVSALARRYVVSTDALYRHRKHIPAQLRAKLLAGPHVEIDLDKLRETESQSLLANLVALRHRLFAALDAAEENGDGFMLTRVSSQLHVNLETTGKLLGNLGVGATTIMNILVQPAYVEMRVELVRALAPYPEARQAVASKSYMPSKAKPRPTSPSTGEGWPHDVEGSQSRT